MEKILTSLNAEQREAVEHDAGPALVLAGAGSGKTRVLTYRAAYLIEEGLSPQELLLVTFTNKAADEMSRRVDQLTSSLGKEVSSGPPGPQMGTFHSVCAWVLRRHGEEAGVSSRYLIYDQADQRSVVKRVLDKLGKSSRSINPLAIVHLISSAKCELIGPPEYQRTAHGRFQELVAEVYPLYQKYLRENGALDFGDLIMETVRLFEERPEILERYRERFRYIMVDEYQDTNHAQYELTRLLAGEGDAEKGPNLFVVGDCSQSIYSFRGADLRNVLRFKSDFPGVRVFNLERNYRSTKTILQTARAVIEPNVAAHPVLELWTDKDAGSPVTIYRARDGVDEARFVTHQIQKLRQYDLDEFAVLYRTNAQSRALEEVFLEVGLPYRLVGGISFYERKEIKDVLAYLKLIANPRDRVSFRRIVNTPRRGIGKVTLEEGGPALEAFYELMEGLREASEGVPVGQLLEKVLRRVGYQEYLEDSTEKGELRWENVLELKSVAQKFSHLSPRESLDRFLENVALMEKTEIAAQGDRLELTEESARVNLMTLHAAKGLEFKVVFIVGMEEGLLPHQRSLSDKRALQEERRLAYVGMTRAEERLFLTHAQSRMYFGKQRVFVPSRFLRSVPDEVVVKL